MQATYPQSIGTAAKPRDLLSPNRGENMSYAAMRGLALCLQAWVFAAFEDEERAAFYYALAALYAVPQISAGFQPNWFSIATLIAGVAHVQVCPFFWQSLHMRRCRQLHLLVATGELSRVSVR